MKSKFRIYVLLIALLAIAATTSMAAGKNDGEGAVADNDDHNLILQGSAIPMYTQPNEGSKIITWLHPGETVKRIDQRTDGWCSIETQEGDAGWIYVAQANLGESSNLEGAAVPMYTQPDEGSKIITWLHPGETVKQISRRPDGWCNIKTQEGDAGWIYAPQ